MLTARVHPGESNSSFMMKGAIDFLIGDTREARVLRKKFVFRIVPMLNPDGVIFGNYRCSLLGVDLNRRWKNPNPHMHPTVYYTKKLMQVFSEDHEIALYCDMHGHSMKKNVFMYACSSKSQNFSVEEKKTNIFIRLVPYLLSKRNPFFSYESCHFRLEKFKESTARIVNFKEFNIFASYTLEASFFGCEAPEPVNDGHLDRKHLESLGRDLCKQLMIFISPKEFRYRISELTDYMNSPASVRKRSYSARKNESKEQKFEKFTLKEVINEIPEEKLEDLIRTEDHSDSGGSDAEASDNDDKKIIFLLKNEKKNKRKKTEKVKSVHVCSNIRHHSNSRIRNVSCTPEIIDKSRSKSRISVIKNSYNNIILKPPIKKVQNKTPDDEPMHNYSYLDLKFKPEYPRRPASGMQVRTSRPQASPAPPEASEVQMKPVQKIFERFIALNFKK